MSAGEFQIGEQSPQARRRLDAAAIPNSMRSVPLPIDPGAPVIAAHRQPRHPDRQRFGNKSKRYRNAVSGASAETMSRPRNFRSGFSLTARNIRMLSRG